MKQGERVFLTLTKSEIEKIDVYVGKVEESIAGAIRIALKEMGMI
ncbi:hypothetical protein [Sulfuricurvum sp.]|nr:hypothetical protein [Sulfuricurvum sp.]